MTHTESVDEAEIAAAVAALTTDTAHAHLNGEPPRSGVYGIRLTTPGLLAPFKEGDGGLIYCGMSSDLEVREFDNHFNSAQTGFSTLRRSLGAILKEQLGLAARPRGSGASKTNFINYRFDPAGDDRLTEWMRKHLKVRTWPTRKYESLEAILKPRLRPLLNLEDWNPHNRAIRSLRKVCADEARLQRRP